MIKTSDYEQGLADIQFILYATAWSKNARQSGKIKINWRASNPSHQQSQIRSKIAAGTLWVALPLIQVLMSQTWLCYHCNQLLPVKLQMRLMSRIASICNTTSCKLQGQDEHSNITPGTSPLLFCILQEMKTHPSAATAKVPLIILGVILASSEQKDATRPQHIDCQAKKSWLADLCP